MALRDLFIADVTRDIPPVIYFHEQSAEKLRDEVGEYIVTGGWPEDDPRHRRVPVGIHEQYVRLLGRVADELEKPGGPELPAVWISGFYGSGKSSFAKLLGLALDGVALPDGTPLAEALLARDRTPKAEEFRAAWSRLTAKVQPVSAVFDIGGMARNNEHIHATVVRQVQRRLGYCEEDTVADFELKLERDSMYDRFLAVARETLGEPWEDVRRHALVEEEFSEVLHRMFPDRYVDPMSWIDSRAGAAARLPSAQEASRAIADMLAFRAKDRTLFIVIDEVSQYLRQDHERMLMLQSFASDLGSRLKGRAWLLVTGQEKLEEESEATVLGKLKDRFPAPLRVHLSPTNIRDVVHRRLLQKTPAAEQSLRELFSAHRQDLQLFAYGCENITAEDFVEVYPLLPGHIDLLMRITSALRTRSTRAQGDDHAIRGLLQMLGELFRAQRLAERDVGALVALDAIYEVQATALDSDVQTSMARVLSWCASSGDRLAERVAKAVALLELIQETDPTTAELVARCLFDHLDAGDQRESVTGALERLRAANLLGFSEKQGYKVQSSAGQEWDSERKNLTATPEDRSGLVQEALKELLADPERPRLSGVSFPWLAFFTDDRGAQDVRLQSPREDAVVTVDFRFLHDAPPSEWVRKSAEEALANRLVWIAGEPGSIDTAARELWRSRKMVEKYEPREASLTQAKVRLLGDERTRARDLVGQLKKAVAAAWTAGRAWFRGRELTPTDFAPTFGDALSGMAARVLPEVYPHFDATVISEAELGPLLERELSGPSTKFLTGGLGILSLDSGRYVPHCEGGIPTRIRQHVEERGGASGQTLFTTFGRPPYGYSPTVVRACLAGLLRGHKIRIRPADGPEITSILDAGTKDLFRRERDLRAADFFPAGQGPLGPRDRIAIAKLFREQLQVEIEPENEAIADAVYQHFPGKAERLRKVEGRLAKLPGSPPTPPALVALAAALEDARRSRQVEPTVLAVKRHLDALREGLPLLAILETELTDVVIIYVVDVWNVRLYQVAQLEEIGALDAEVAEAAARIEAHLALERPWRGIEVLAPDLETVRAAYRRVRAQILTAQEAEAEQARGRVKRRPGFERLNADQSNHVLRPLAEVVRATSAEAIAPTLLALRDGFPAALRRAEEEANDRLDQLLWEIDEREIVKIETGLRGRVVSQPAEFEALVRELRERVEPHLRAGKRVRFLG